MRNKKLARKVSKLSGVKKVIVDDTYTVYFKSGYFKDYTLKELKVFYVLEKNNKSEFVNPDLETDVYNRELFLQSSKVIDILAKFEELHLVVSIHVFYEDSCFKSIGIETEDIIYERDNLDSLKRLYERLRQEEFKVDWRKNYRVKYIIKSFGSFDSVESIKYNSQNLNNKRIIITCIHTSYVCEGLPELESVYQEILADEKLAKENTN